jgi:hypothetical protein
MNNISICWSSNRYLVIWMNSLWIVNMKYMTLCYDKWCDRRLIHLWMNNISICLSSNRYLVIWMNSLWIVNMKYMTLCYDKWCDRRLIHLWMNNISICWSSNRYLVIWMNSLWIVNMKYITLIMTIDVTDVWYICEWIIFQCVDLPVDIWSFEWILYELSTWNIWHFVWQITWQTFDTFVNE